MSSGKKAVRAIAHNGKVGILAFKEKNKPSGKWIKEQKLNAIDAPWYTFYSPETGEIPMQLFSVNMVSSLTMPFLQTIFDLDHFDEKQNKVLNYLAENNPEFTPFLVKVAKVMRDNFPDFVTPPIWEDRVDIDEEINKSKEYIKSVKTFISLVESGKAMFVTDAYGRSGILAEEVPTPSSEWQEIQNCKPVAGAKWYRFYPMTGGAANIQLVNAIELRELTIEDIQTFFESKEFNPARETVMKYMKEHNAEFSGYLFKRERQDQSIDDAIDSDPSKEKTMRM